MKKLTKIICSLLMTTITLSTYATGMPVVDVAAIAQLVQQAQMIEKELASLQNFNWSNNSQSQQTLQQLANYIQQAGSLAQSAQSAEQQFQQYYPGYQAPQDFSGQYKNILNDTMSALQGVTKASAYINQNNNIQAENANMNKVQSQIQSATGQTQAIQGLSQINENVVTELQTLRQTMVAQTSAQNAYYMAEVQKEASSQAELDKVIGDGSTTAPAVGQSGNTLVNPNF